MSPMESMQNHKIITGTVAAGLLVGGVVLGAMRYEGDPASSGDRTEQDDLQDDLRALLTVDTTNVDCAAVVQETGVGNVVEVDSGSVVEFDVGATKHVEYGNPDARGWSDGLSTPFKSAETDNASLLKELQATLCEDPELGSTFANMFANMEVEGVKVVDLNPWLKEFEGDPSNINDKASESMPLQDRAPESISDEELDNAVKENQEYQLVAEKLGTLLTRFQNTGVTEAGPTTFNYNLVAGGLVAGGLPEVGLNATQFETAKGVTFVLTKKDGECLVTLMVNIGDKRPEGIEACADIAPEVPAETVPGDTTPATGGPEQPTTTRHGNTTTTITGVTVTTGGPTTSRRPEVTAPASIVIGGPGSPGTPDQDNNPDNNTTTSVNRNPTTTGSTIVVTVPTTSPEAPTTVATVITG